MSDGVRKALIVFESSHRLSGRCQRVSRRSHMGTGRSCMESERCQIVTQRCQMVSGFVQKVSVSVSKISHLRKIFILCLEGISWGPDCVVRLSLECVRRVSYGVRNVSERC